MNKKKIDKPQVSIIKISNNDIICTSNASFDSFEQDDDSRQAPMRYSSDDIWN